MPPPETKISKIKLYVRARWKELTFALAATIAAGIIGYALIYQHFFVGSKEANLSFQEKSDTVASPLTGVQVSPRLAARPVTGIMIENSTDARPQSGISQAGVVFEAVAEGGITRFLTLFQEARPKNLGPVRSLRPYYLYWALGYDAGIGHVGGSATAQRHARQQNAKDLDQFRYGTTAYWRTSDRAAPHNVYTSFGKLDKLNKKLGYTKSVFTPYARKDDSPVSKSKVKKLSFDFSGPLYKATWSYNAKSNRYLRTIAGVKDRDRASGKRISAKNIVYIPMPTGYDSVGHAVMPVVGKGRAILFRDGKAIRIKWSKKSAKSMIVLKNKDGSEVELNVGTTWFEVVPSGRSVSY